VEDSEGLAVISGTAGEIAAGTYNGGVDKPLAVRRRHDVSIRVWRRGPPRKKKKGALRLRRYDSRFFSAHSRQIQFFKN